MVFGHRYVSGAGISIDHGNLALLRGATSGFPLREHVGQRLRSELRAELINGRVHRLLELRGGRNLLAGGPLQRLDGVDDVEQGDLAGRLGERDAAADSATGVDQSAAAHRLEHLGQVGAGHLRLRGNVLGGGGSRRVGRQLHHGSQGVFDGL